MTSALSQRRAATARRRRQPVLGDLLTNVEWSEYANELDQLFDDYCVAREERYRALRASGATVPRALLPWRPSSQEVYWNVWTAFTTYLVKNLLRLDALTRGSLEAYIAFLEQRDRVGGVAAGELDKRYLRRLLAFIEKMVAFDAERRGVPANTAVADYLEAHPEVREANERRHEEVPTFLDRRDRERLKHVLTLPVGSPAKSKGAATSWKQLRDNAAVAVQLGAGLTPGEVRTLEMTHVLGDARHGYEFKLKATGNLKMRMTALAPWARAPLAAWLHARSDLAALRDSPHVFCTDEGTQWSKNKAVQATEEVFARAGLKAKYAAYQLRHTFVLTAREEGVEWGLIAGALGIHDTFSWRSRYQAALAPIRA